jgi:hypothetical protein
MTKEDVIALVLKLPVHGIGHPNPYANAYVNRSEVVNLIKKII